MAVSYFIPPTHPSFGRVIYCLAWDSKEEAYLEWREVLGKGEMRWIFATSSSMAALGIALVLSLGDDASEVRATFKNLNSRRDIWAPTLSFWPCLPAWRLKWWQHASCIYIYDACVIWSPSPHPQPKKWERTNSREETLLVMINV